MYLQLSKKIVVLFLNDLHCVNQEEREKTMKNIVIGADAAKLAGLQMDLLNKMRQERNPITLPQFEGFLHQRSMQRELLAQRSVTAEYFAFEYRRTIRSQPKTALRDLHDRGWNTYDAANAVFKDVAKKCAYRYCQLGDLLNICALPDASLDGCRSYEQIMQIAKSVRGVFSLHEVLRIFASHRPAKEVGSIPAGVFITDPVQHDGEEKLCFVHGHDIMFSTPDTFIGRAGVRWLYVNPLT